VVTNEEFLFVNGVVASPFSVSHVFPNVFYNMIRLLYALSPRALDALQLEKVTNVLGRALSF
jgi:hypothetical protein